MQEKQGRRKSGKVNTLSDVEKKYFLYIFSRLDRPSFYCYIKGRIYFIHRPY